MSHPRCQHSCHGCPSAVSRRNFVKGGAVALAAGATGLASGAAARPRVAVFCLSDPKPVENWPYPGWNPEPRIKKVTEKLTQGCPDVEFEFFSSHKGTVAAGMAAKDKFDGVLVHTMTLGSITGQARQIGEWGKPMVLSNYVLGGCWPFLGTTTWAADTKKPIVSVSTTRDEDLVKVAQCFGAIKREGLSAEQFAARGWEVYRTTFGAADAARCIDDPVRVASTQDVVKRLNESRIVVVGSGKPGTTGEFLGSKVIYVGFDEFAKLCAKVDADEANAKADVWMKRAMADIEAKPAAIRESAKVALATRALMKKHSSDTLTMNCLGGFASGNLPAYPCLGFTELLDEGQHGVCEAQLPDCFAMIVSRGLTGRAGFVSDPTIDTSTNQIIYAHCMAPTKMLGTSRPASPFRIRTLHNRDERSACVQSFMPENYMTTSFRVVGKSMLIHQAKSAGNCNSDHGCRSQLLGDVVGDIEKLMKHWHAWHRVTVYGDVKEPLKELASALKLKVIEEA
jgi:L-fucose isomerase-like protein